MSFWVEWGLFCFDLEILFYFEAGAQCFSLSGAEQGMHTVLPGVFPLPNLKLTEPRLCQLKAVPALRLHLLHQHLGYRSPVLMAFQGIAV